jgi:hypothetical protein
VHEAFLVLGGLTVLSTLIFSGLKSADGNVASQHKVQGMAAPT